MKIQFSKHSGWMPARFFEIDTDQLAASERQQVEALVHQSAILTDAPVEQDEPAIRDGDEYTLEITTATGTYHWQWYGIGRPTGPDALLDLLSYCGQRASPKK
ncbi:MAG: hypothetical protein K2W95_17980 [Candidatus Obscuribacterales bacterium]|nr:hypothetical protein [Candidatus Obscuribacterales bacterium]